MPHDPRPAAVAEIAARFVPGTGPIEVLGQQAGLVNRTFRVARNGKSYGVRLAADDAALGRDAPWERRVLLAASAAGLAPAIVAQDTAAGVLVTYWTDGRVWDAAEVRREGNLERMARTIREVQGLAVEAPRRLMSPGDWLAAYDGGGAKGDLWQAVREWQQAFAAAGRASPVLCHSDLHVHNVLDAAPRLILLDWEYAHMGEPLWDLAAWISNNDLDAAAASTLLGAYFGRPPAPAEEQRLELLCWMFDYVCLLWSERFREARGAHGPVDARSVVLRSRLANRPWS